MDDPRRPVALPGPLVVRLRNWVGDVVLSVPSLLRLEAAGHGLHLVGKGWAKDLLAGYGWPVHVMPKERGDRVRQLRELRGKLGSSARALVFPYAFSAALEFRLAGLPAEGFACQFRSPLLRRAFPRPGGVHTRDEYWSLCQSFLGRREPAPAPAEWRLSAEAGREADRLIRENGLGPDFVVLVPFASNGPDDPRVWPDFPGLASRLVARGAKVVLCPGSEAEADAAVARYPGAVVLRRVGMSAYGALMRRAGVVVATDTGPGHLAAATGANLISIFGPSSPDTWGPVGSRVRILREDAGWPSLEAVLAKAAPGSSMTSFPPP